MRCEKCGAPLPGREFGNNDIITIQTEVVVRIDSDPLLEENAIQKAKICMGDGIVKLLTEKARDFIKVDVHRNSINKNYATIRASLYVVELEESQKSW